MSQALTACANARILRSFTECESNAQHLLNWLPQGSPALWRSLWINYKSSARAHVQFMKVPMGFAMMRIED